MFATNNVWLIIAVKGHCKNSACEHSVYQALSPPLKGFGNKAKLPWIFNLVSVLLWVARYPFSWLNSSIANKICNAKSGVNLFTWSVLKRFLFHTGLLRIWVLAYSPTSIPQLDQEYIQCMQCHIQSQFQVIPGYGIPRSIQVSEMWSQTNTELYSIGILTFSGL